ncbi:LPXTG cell wall anchor domain-containing protein [Weissella confusa]|uniref:LPXTG cell wall anchor domain-containing protein n=1 Tax=Weissella confusa TaxID=1583 RepID=UPI001C6FA4C7|nr:LPXTG cell wall anchor domain-containing protein [Weissella confusa]QYU58839.1 LPXTG cell wall anchor domain-containing protein [Weissella confusa]
MDGTVIDVHHVSGDAYQGALVGGNVDNSVFTAGSGHAHDNDSYDVFTFGDGGFYLIPVTVGDMDTPTGPNSGPIEQHVDISTSNGSISFGPVTGPDGSLDGNTDSHGSVVHWFDWTNSVSIHGYVQDNVDIGNNITIFGDGKAQVDVETVVVPPTEPTKPDVPSTSFVFQDVVAPSLVANYQKTDVEMPSMDPTKDVVVSVSDQTSLNDSEIELGQIFDYELNGSVRPAGYDGTTVEWSATDQLDILHDQFTGEWQVYTNSDIVMPDGSIIKAGSDISKYFSESYDAETGTFKISMNNELMAILNSPENKAIAQSWSAYIQAKRIAPGTVYNTFDESYNNWKVQSNRVETFTPEPEKPVTPKPAEPAQAVPTSAPVAKQAAGVVALPETGAEKHNGLTAAGMAIGLALLGTSAMMKRRKDEEN